MLCVCVRACVRVCVCVQPMSFPAPSAAQYFEDLPSFMAASDEVATAEDMAAPSAAAVFANVPPPPAPS